MGPWQFRVVVINKNRQVILSCRHFQLHCICGNRCSKHRILNCHPTSGSYTVNPCSRGHQVMLLTQFYCRRSVGTRYYWSGGVGEHSAVSTHIWFTSSQNLSLKCFVCPFPTLQGISCHSSQKRLLDSLQTKRTC